CMQKKPERRYLTAAELIHDLKKSITNPDGDFVKLTTGVVTDSPTIHLTDDEMHHIKSATKSVADTYQPPVKEEPKKVASEEDEDLDSVDTKLEKVLTIGSIVMIAVIAVVIIVVVGKFMGFFGKSSSNEELTPTPIISETPTPEITQEAEPDKSVVTVPNVVGLVYDEAVKSLRAVSEYFNITTIEEYSSEYEAGYVIKQDPISGSDIVSNSNIKLTVSIGAETAEVPNVYGVSMDQAIQTLEAQGFVVADPVYQSNEEVGANMVIKTDPEKGTTAKKGDKITIYVSEGPAVTSVEVPLLIGLTQAAAEERLAEKGLILGKVSPVSSTQYAVGTVSYQSTTAGQSVPKGTTIDISISTGPDNATASPTPVPTIPTTEPTATPTPVPEESTETGGSATRFVGKVTITYNPFAEGESGEIYLELTQDGEAMEIITKTLSYSDFPYTVSFEGIKEGSGIVTMYINGTPYTEQSWSVNLTAEKY
ncbi:MAG: PASTA domain-containing protein, partial [Lachnospiraceae bacterium]|nr:PASTA domain-containing protein [Lachnospiraceae bacterium]